ncbi:MAG: SGNH/GDSL hydrolase family protein [Acidobacteria bacterium]|nr:SGNH/GDSL hydrolase family protein [Acidobacteriota bacterium]
MKSSWHFARAVVVTLAGVATGIILLELLFGGNRINPLSIPKNTDLRFEVRGLYASEDGPTVRYRRDPFGFRGTYSHPSTIDILTLGGSTTDQRFLDENRTWQAVLAVLFNRNGRSVEVVNAGVDGQSTAGNLANFTYWFPAVPDLRPRYILVYVGTNDLFLNGGEVSQFDQLRRGSALTSILKQSALFDLYRKLKGAYLARQVYLVSHGSMRLADIEWTTKPLVAHIDWLEDPVVARRLDQFEDRLVALHSRIVAMGAEPIFVTQKGRHYRKLGETIWGMDREWELFGREVNGVDLGRLMILQFARTLEVCRSLGAVCVDTSTLEYEDTDFYDAVHNTPSGAAKVGQFVYSKLIPLFPAGRRHATGAPLTN